MKEQTVRTQMTDMSYWVGLDWGNSKHAVCVADDARGVVSQFSVAPTPEGFAELREKLSQFTRIGGVAVESTRNLLISFLVEAGYVVYLINPKLSKNWRAGVSVSDVKSDARDGRVLATELARRHESLRAYVPRDKAAAELASFCEKRRVLVEDRTAHVQRLKSVLAQYHPAMLAFFDEWTSPVAWRFLRKFSTPESFAGARKTNLIGLLKSNKIGIKPVWEERIDKRVNALKWPVAQDAAALEIMALATAAQLHVIEMYIRKLDTLIKEKSEAFPEAKLVATVTGAGPVLTPELTAMLISPEAREGGYEALRGLAGTAPVTQQSGKQRRVSKRNRCNPHWRNTLHLFAFCSRSSKGWAKAYYDLRRSQGDSFGTALRKLADKWLKILVRMIQNSEPYDESRHVESLRKHDSPTCKNLPQQACG